MARNNNIESHVHETPFTILFRLFSNWSRVVASMVSLSAVGYLIGWLSAKAYFNQFGATWIISYLSAQDIFWFATSPLFYLVFFSWNVLTYLNSDWPSKDAWISPVIMTFLLLLAPVVVAVFHRQGVSQKLYVSMPSLLSLVAALFLVPIILITAKRMRSGLLLPPMVAFFVLLSIWIIPTVTGKFEGRRDRNVSTSELPSVTLANKEYPREHHLLFSANGRFFVVELESPSKYPPISVFEGQQIARIMKEDKKQ